MSYIDAIHDKARDVIHVVERIDGCRLYETYPIMWEAYYEATGGDYTTIYGTKANKISARTRSKFIAELRTLGPNTRLFEHDTNPIFDILSKHYSGGALPDLNIGFFDLEVDFDPSRGYAPPSDPFSAITAISLYISKLEKNITLVLPPSTISWKEAQRIADCFDDTFIFDNEEDLLKTFLDLIEDVDVLSGWNSEGFDIPYLVNRIIMILGGDYTRKLCLWDMKPRSREYEKYGKKQTTYDLVGRLHLDYLQLYHKYTYHEMHSYSLDTIGEHEVGETKVPYEGTLDSLYKNDFYKFIEYNRQDTALLVKIDAKLKFIDIANVVAHDNTVLIQTTMGAVAVTDQAIINESHRLGLVVPSRKPRTFGEEEDIDLRKEYDAETAKRAVGAYVANPKKGLHDWPASTDIKSLYPSVIRSLNMSPETLVGQVHLGYTNDLIRSRLRAQKGKTPSVTKAWEGEFSTIEYGLILNKDTSDMMELEFVDGQVIKGTGAELYKLIYEKNAGQWAITANGTVFRTDKLGIIPGLLGRWYAERQQRQAHMWKFTSILSGYVPDRSETKLVESSIQPMPSVYKFDFEALDDILTSGDSQQTSDFFQKWHLKSVDGAILPSSPDLWKGAEEFWDKQQLVRKIGLNSLYGALLNKGSRFNDVRIGQSTTLTGRCITKHMASKINEILTGEYDHVGKSIIYGDTDSVYFSVWPIVKDSVEAGDVEWNADKAIEFYDLVAAEMNTSFSEFMHTKFGVSREAGGIIQAGREIVASKGLFITKKRYAALIIDDEGRRRDINGKPGKIKVMGLEIKRSDTPADVQAFLEDLITKVLAGMTESDAMAMIREFKLDYHDKKPWEKGTPKRVNNLTNHTKKFNRTGKCSVGHAKAAINWNRLREMNSDRYSAEIQDGAKTIVCKLKPNSLGMDSIAYPIDQARLPEWFTSLPFNETLMEITIVDKKVKNLLGELGWDLSAADTTTTAHALFIFE